MYLSTGHCFRDVNTLQMQLNGAYFRFIFAIIARITDAIINYIWTELVTIYVCSMY